MGVLFQQRSNQIGWIEFWEEPDNLLTESLLRTLLQTLRTARQQPLRFLVLTARHQPTFSLGVHFPPPKTATLPDYQKILQLFHKVLRALLEMPMPTATIIQGTIAGGAIALALATDLRFLLGDPTPSLIWTGPHEPLLLPAIPVLAHAQSSTSPLLPLLLSNTSLPTQHGIGSSLPQPAQNLFIPAQQEETESLITQYINAIQPETQPHTLRWTTHTLRIPILEQFEHLIPTLEHEFLQELAHFLSEPTTTLH